MFYLTMVFSQFVYKMYNFSLTKKENENEKILYALHFKCSYLYTKTHKEKVQKTPNELLFEWRVFRKIRREESRSPLALPELRLYLTRCCSCYRRVTRSEVILCIRTQSVPSLICGNTHRQNKTLFILCHTNIS